MLTGFSFPNEHPFVPHTLKRLSSGWVSMTLQKGRILFLQQISLVAEFSCL